MTRPIWAKVEVAIDLPDGQQQTYYFRSKQDLQSCIETATYYSVLKPEGYLGTINQQFPLAAVFFPIVDHGTPPPWMQEIIDNYISDMQLHARRLEKQEMRLQTG